MSRSKKSKVLVFIVQYPNFSETYMQEEIRYLKENYDVHIVTYVKSPFPRREPFDYTLIEYKLPCFVYYPYTQIDWSLSEPESVKFLAEIGKVIEDFQPDILHGHYFGMSALLERLADTYKLPFTVRTHSMDVLREPAEKLEKLCALSNSAWCAGILALPYFRQRLLDHGLAESKLVDCWPLINFERFHQPEKRKLSGKILCAGPSSPKKAHKDFIELALKMKEAGSQLEFDLYTDGYTLKDTVDYNESRGKPVRITYADPDDMPEVCAQYDWLIYPADPKINRVGFPVGLVEAQASGLGVIWQELPERREEQLRNLGGAGMLYRSIDEVPEIISRPYPEEMRQKGFERAKMCDAKDQSHLLTDRWESFLKRRESIERPGDLVSIVISYYEKPNEICESIKSALEQSHKNIEVIVVDDASSEYPAASIIDDSLLGKIKLITHKTNLGVSAARNTAVRASSGKYIVPLDADDLLHQDFALRCLQAAVSGDLDSVYTQMQWFGDSDYLMTPRVNLVNLLCHKEGFPTLFYSRKVFDAIGGYREDMPVGSDHQFLLSIAAGGFSIVRIEAPLWFYRKSCTGLAEIDVEKRISNLIASNHDLYEKHWSEVIVSLDSYYLAVFQEYHRAIKANAEQYNHIHAEYDAVLEERHRIHREYISLLEENSRFRSIYEEYKNVLAAYERLVDDSTRLGRENRSQGQLIESLKKTLDITLSAPNTASLKDKVRSDARNLINLWTRTGKTNREEIESFQKSGVFDENHYRRQCRQKGIAVSDALVHFAEIGWKIPLNPSPLFDIEFYQKQLKLRRIEYSSNPLSHYLQQGAREGIATSELFDTHWYLSHYADVRESGLNPLAHYISFGALEGRHSTLPGASILKDMTAAQNNQNASCEEVSIANNSDTPPTDFAHGTTYDLIVALHEASLTGAPLVGQALARGLKKRGLTPLLVLCKGGPLLQDLSNEFDVVDLSAQVDPQSMLSEHLTRLEESGRLTSSTVILNSVELHPLQRMLKERGMKVITLIHEFLSLYPQHIRENLKRTTDLAVFSCQSVFNEAHNLIPGTWPRCEIISQGLIDPEFGKRYQRKEARQILSDATGASGDDFVILACATAETRKGIDLFVQVARDVLSRSRKARFVWIGGSHNPGPEALQWAKKDAERAGVKDRIDFIDSMENIEPFFTGADCFVLPSRLDPFPCVVHQAMASSLPVIAFSGSGGVEEMLNSGGGTLVPYLDVAAMSTAIMELIENPSMLAEKGRQAATIVSQRYVFQDYVDRLVDVANLEKKEASTPATVKVTARV